MDQQIRFCTSSDGVRIAYATMGDGPPLVKAPNWLTHLEYDWDSPVWRHWLEGFARHHTLIRFDERGCGLSDWHVENFSLEAWVGDLESVVNQLGLERFPLLGISQGGLVAIQYALRHPEKVSQLILYGSYLRGQLLIQPDSEQIETLLKLTKIGWGQDNPAYRQVFTALFVPDATLEQMRWFNELQRQSTSPENAVRFLKAFYSMDVSELAPRVTTPTLVLHARQDAMNPFEAGRRLASIIPGARFVPLESRNHILLEDEPAWQHFLREVYSFLGIEDMNTVVAPDRQNVAGRTFGELTRRELEVFDLLAQGYRNAEIAERLFLSPKTVRNYVSNIFSKLHVENRAQAIILAREQGLGSSQT